MSDLLALQLFSDASGFLGNMLAVIAAIILFSAAMVYLLSWVSRYVEYLKMQESKYIDPQVVHRVLEVIWIGLFVITVMAIAQFASKEVGSLLAQLIERFPAAVFVIVTLLVAAVLVRALRRFGIYVRAVPKTDARAAAGPRLWGVTEVFLKYFIIGIALLIAFVGAVDLLPASVPERAYLEGVRQSLTTPSSQLLTAVAIAVAGVLVGFGLSRLSDSVFEDMKQRSGKHGPQVLEQFKRFTRALVYAMTIVVVLFLELSLVLNETQLLVVAVAFLVVFAVAMLIAFDSLRNAFAGVSLMMSDPYALGDHVQIGEGTLGEIVGITLTMTHVRTAQGEKVTLPNRTVLASPVLNFTRSEHHSIAVDVEVGFDVPHKEVEDLLLEAAKRTPGVLEEPAPQVYGRDVLGNAIVHRLLAYTNDMEQIRRVKGSLVYAIQDLFHDRKLRVLTEPASKPRPRRPGPPSGT